jgi:uncharacterized protein (DUF2235 family)
LISTGFNILASCHQNHALAIDEHRNDFAPTLWDVHHPKDQNAVIAQARPLSSVEQRWFVGAHANVGGGYQTDLLAQAPLRWMMKKAERVFPAVLIFWPHEINCPEFVLPHLNT